LNPFLTANGSLTEGLATPGAVKEVETVLEQIRDWSQQHTPVGRLDYVAVREVNNKHVFTPPIEFNNRGYKGW
jgi:hypothetical protein